jgi:hypothetical protein
VPYGRTRRLGQLCHKDGVPEPELLSYYHLCCVGWKVSAEVQHWTRVDVVAASTGSGTGRCGQGDHQRSWTQTPSLLARLGNISTILPTIVDRLTEQYIQNEEP